MDYSQAIAYWTSLCLSCAPNVSPATTTAIITIESRGNPLAIGDNTTHKSYSPKNAESAVKIAQSLLDQKHSIDIGLMQVNSAHIKSMHLNLTSLFDSCYNISVGSRILTDFYVKHSKTSPNFQEALLKAISSYNTGNPYKGYYNGYVSKILKSVNYDFVTPQPQQSQNYTNTSNASTVTEEDSKPITLIASSDFKNSETNQDSQEQPVTSFFIKNHN